MACFCFFTKKKGLKQWLVHILFQSAYQLHSDFASHFVQKISEKNIVYYHLFLDKWLQDLY